MLVNINSHRNNLPEDFEGKNLLIAGSISSLPQRDELADEFEFDVKKLNDLKQRCKIKLRWYGEHPNSQPAKWQLEVRLMNLMANLILAGSIMRNTYSRMRSVRPDIIASENNKLLAGEAYSNFIITVRQRLGIKCLK